ncbi:tripartite tricarboxylate transporter substrate-binding protein [Cupriavidus consociatus]|uniref:tripartite tricarboxylate transporter substrate-binding protein n=1 Tax=Cupriavidus consociatus TaxID=2821357 RepID=UPI001FD73BBF|nr:MULTISPECIES: tripartite tricarboxylate transporter substrate-binding protein [unclassified Cupriavidus]MDK2660769.1 tripartite tricarboxylate transporter substrate-binding protein [Cupriavidus sp. LEh21]
MMKSIRHLLALVAVAVLAANPACAQSPAATGSATTPLRLVVGFPPGGALDTLARALADQLRLAGMGTVIVENRPGASTRISIDAVKRSQPDGRTVLLSSNAPMVIFPMTYRRLDYDVDRDFIAVAQLAEVPTVISAGADRPYKTLREYVNWVRANPSQGSIGLTSLGGTLHFAILGMGRTVGVALRPVAYKGGAPLVTDLVGGHVPLATDALASQLELYRAGKIRILAVSGTHRNPALPDVPTAREEGIDAFDHANATYSAFVPAGTPPEAVQRLERAFVAAMQKPQMKVLLSRVGLEATGLPGATVTRTLHAEREFWRPLVQASGFRNED